MCTKWSLSQRNWLLCGFCCIPLVLGATAFVLGIWLSIAVIQNGMLPTEQQIQFEKLNKWVTQHDSEGDHGPNVGVTHLENEPSFSHTPIDNLCFYLLALSFVAILGGSGRIVGTTFFCLHLLNNRVTGHLFWAWLVLSVLAVTIEVLVTYDILLTLSHNDVSPPYYRDFFLINDAYGFYLLCHAFRVFIWVDLCVSALSQCAVCWLYRSNTTRRDL